jgi:hypothetical protein
MMGLFDLPSPMLGWIDGLLTSLPTLLRLVLWGAVAGALSMWLYRWISPQQRIARSRQEQLEARRSLDAFDGELAEAWPLIRRLLGLSLSHVGRVTGPAVVASLPVLCLLVWMSTAYGHHYPAEPPEVRVSPAPLQGRWLPGRDQLPRVRVTNASLEPLVEVPVPAPVPVIEKWHWWNALVGNPAGYLDAQNPAERLEIALPRREIVSAGPDWMRGWEVPFFVSLIIASLLLKRLLHIH